MASFEGETWAAHERFGSAMGKKSPGRRGGGKGAEQNPLSQILRLLRHRAATPFPSQPGKHQQKRFDKTREMFCAPRIFRHCVQRVRFQLKTKPASATCAFRNNSRRRDHALGRHRQTERERKFLGEISSKRLGRCIIEAPPPVNDDARRTRCAPNPQTVRDICSTGGSHAAKSPPRRQIRRHWRLSGSHRARQNPRAVNGAADSLVLSTAVARTITPDDSYLFDMIESGRIFSAKASMSWRGECGVVALDQAVDKRAPC